MQRSEFLYELRSARSSIGLAIQGDVTDKVRSNYVTEARDKLLKLLEEGPLFGLVDRGWGAGTRALEKVHGLVSDIANEWGSRECKVEGKCDCTRPINVMQRLDRIYGRIEAIEDVLADVK